MFNFNVVKWLWAMLARLPITYMYEIGKNWSVDKSITLFDILLGFLKKC